MRVTLASVRWSGVAVLAFRVAGPPSSVQAQPDDQKVLATIAALCRGYRLWVVG